jgi:hypothetical protein
MKAFVAGQTNPPLVKIAKAELLEHGAETDGVRRGDALDPGGITGDQRSSVGVRRPPSDQKALTSRASVN